MRTRLFAGLCCIGGLLAQETGQDLVNRVAAGGWLAKAKYRRGASGELEWWQPAGPAHAGEFVPLMGTDGEDGLNHYNLGWLGYLTLCCHGDGDLLAMTDVAFHFGALGLGSSDAELRQFLVVPPPSFDGPLGRAALFDRLLAIDRLAERRCRAAKAELGVLAADAALPAVLRERSEQALRRLRGEVAVDAPRRRLDPAVVTLPAVVDACLVVEHAHLPDLRWLAAHHRRLGAMLVARSLERGGALAGIMAPSQLQGGQRMCDVAAEAPFWFAHRCGNARLDHSLVVVELRPGAAVPFVLTWDAVGEFEPERWRDARLSIGSRDDNPLAGGTVHVAATSLHASTRGHGEGRPSPELAAKLLRDDGAALRVVLPAASKLWAEFAFLQLPPATAAEMRLVFGDPATVVLQIDARDEDTARAWEAKGKQLLDRAQRARSDLPEAWRARPAAMALLDALLAPKLRVQGSRVVAEVELRGFDQTKMTAIVEALMLSMP